MTLTSSFLDYCRDERELQPGTIRAYERRIGYLEEALGKPIERITSDDLRAFKKQAKGRYSSQTIGGMLSVARAFHRWGVLDGHWNQNGVALVQGPRILNAGPPPLSIEKAERVMAACRRPLGYRLVYLSLFAGLRIGESAAFEGSQWLDDGFLRFRGEKNQQLREVPIHPHLEAVKWKVLASEPTYTSTLQRVKRRLERRSGVKFVSHQLRKTFSTALYDNDVDDRVVKALLGHSQDVTGRYVVVSRRKKQEAILRLPY